MINRVLVHNGAMNTKQTPPLPEVRLTIPVSAEVHQTFARISKAGNMPIGRAMGEWLQDTIDAAAFMAEKMEQARKAPALVARELHSYALGLSDQTQELMAQMRKGGKASGSPAGHPPFGIAKRTPPPVSNTGGKPPNTKNGKNRGSA
jgi:hypothetical protein